MLRFLQVYDDAAAKMGIRLSIGCDFNEYIAITASLADKPNTYPIFRPDRSPIRTGEGYWLVGFDKENKVALVEAARFYDLSQTTLAAHLETLKFFYANPTIDAHPEDRCVCTAQMARSITGKVVYHGDIWIRPDFRGSGLLKIMTGTMRGVSLAMWAPDFLCGLAGRWSLDKNVYDPVHNEPGGADIHLVQENIVANDWLFWMTGYELKQLLDVTPDLN
ncbi:hypothetical protein EAS54_37960 [Bradyrhizobium guangzhouense]|uniref:N-acetyltransferase domain-containing protein n=1 Tax=Bradyrhizobium guangdongense TaxID=1325090 RepID=A0A7S7VD71_9BRAD|nr:hypothetical protein XH90_36060 [Bradyrhizobium sp. CCBAU 53338]QOZ64470.1 hypothetical protein XH86_37865 [Bradyrhizobium guangdongense]RXH07370.1 hypothetical protein EAS54_37960 [Bradyrhizobium guangzhouense]